MVMWTLCGSPCRASSPTKGAISTEVRDCRCGAWTVSGSSAGSSHPDEVAPENQGEARLPAEGNVPPRTTREPEWADAGKGAIRQGDLQVQISKISIGRVPLETRTGWLWVQDSWSQDNLLMIQLELLNTSPTRKLEYRPWSGKDISFERDYATLRDNLGNSYKRIGFGLRSLPVGAVEQSESIYPKKSVTDVLVFELPVDTAEYLRLELPAKNFGGTGMLRLQIPKAMIQR